MLIVDSHVHTGADWAEPVEVLLFQMERNGVSNAVLIGHNGNYDNSYLLDCVRRYDGRFKAVGLVDPQDPSRVKALEAFAKAGGSGIRVNIRQEREWGPDNALFEAAGDLGIVISVIGKAENFASARFKKLLDDCPKTHFNLEHLARSPGNDVAKPPYDAFEAAMTCADWPNTTLKVPGLGEILVRPDIMPKGYPWYIPPHYEMAKAAFGVERMMWGSNFPPCAAKEGYRNALQAVRDLDVFKDSGDQEWVFGRTAARLWGFAS